MSVSDAGRNFGDFLRAFSFLVRVPNTIDDRLRTLSVDSDAEELFVFVDSPEAAVSQDREIQQ